MLISFLIVLCYAAAVIGLGVLARAFGLPKNYSRKIVHILVGGEWILLFRLFGAGWQTLAVCLFFTAVNLLSFVFRWFDNSMGSDGDNAPGTVYYAVSMSIMAGICMFRPEGMIPFGLAVAFTSLGDGFAGVAGSLVKRKNPALFGSKTLYGSMTAFLVCLGSAFVFNAVFSMQIAWYTLVFLAFFAAEVELCSKRGADNLLVPLLTFGMTFAAQNGQASEWIAACLLIPAIYVISSKKNALTGSGLIAAVLDAAIIAFVFGNVGFACLLAFFVFGQITDLPKKHKKNLSSFEEKPGARDAYQVLANGGTAALCAILFFIFRRPALLFAAVASLAEALADTAASGLGVTSERTFDVFRMKRIAAGESGGMSIIGTVSGLLGAILISCLAGLMLGASVTAVLAVAVAGFSGCVFDSFLGSAVQGKYVCSVCGKHTERRIHCGAPAEKISGASFVNNDFVNFASTLFSALAAYLIFEFA